MPSSPLRRALPVSLLLASLTLLPAVAHARIVSPGLTDSAAAARAERQGFFERLWGTITHLLGAEGIRIDPNGKP